VLSPGGSGYFKCKQNMKLITTKFKSGGSTWEACSGNLESWEPSQHLLLGTGKPRKPVSRLPVAGPSEYWLLASSPASKVRKKQCPHSTTNTHKITTHTRQLQYTRSTNNNYTKDNLKLVTKHTRHIRILQHVKKVKTPKYVFLQSLIHSRFHPSLSLLITYCYYKPFP